jgi:MADS-box transcription factor
MGRRKIAIQPITNDRTRSVTFLKRKTGLFKKAYELGVLCSVDVAVIIFGSPRSYFFASIRSAVLFISPLSLFTERKHGHPDKLFQYCSTDIDSLVQRQIRFDGERDLRTPHDFTGGANLSRLDDMGEDDDDADADDSPTASYIRHDGIKGKNIPDSGKPSGAKPKDSSEVDYRLHLPGTVPSSSPTLPISADRHTHQSNPPANRVSSSSSSYAAPSPNPRKRPKMDDHSSTAPSPVSGVFPTHAQPGHPPPPQQQQHGHAYQSGFFPGFSSSHGLSPPLPHGSSLHTPASFPSPTGGGTGSGGAGGGGGGGGGPPLHLLQTAAAVTGYGSSPRHHPPRITQPHHFGLSAEDLFASVFGGPAGGSGVGLDLEFDFLAPPLTFDWPQFGPPTHAGGAGSNQHHQQTTTTTSAPGGGGGGGGGGGDSSSSSSWLDFLSGAADAPRSPRMGKHSRGDGLGSSGGGGGGGGGSFGGVLPLG